MPGSFHVSCLLSAPHASVWTQESCCKVSAVIDSLKSSPTADMEERKLRKCSKKFNKMLRGLIFRRNLHSRCNSPGDIVIWLRGSLYLNTNTVPFLEITGTFKRVRIQFSTCIAIPLLRAVRSPSSIGFLSSLPEI